MKSKMEPKIKKIRKRKPQTIQRVQTRSQSRKREMKRTKKMDIIATDVVDIECSSTTSKREIHIHRYWRGAANSKNSKMPRIIAIDLETTGVKQKRKEIVAWAWVDLENQKQIQYFLPKSGTSPREGY